MRYSLSMKILIADPHPEVRDALRLIAGRIPGVTTVSVAGSLVQLLAQCAQACPDLVLFDLGLVQPTRAHPQALPDVIGVLRRLCPAGRVAVMSSHLDAQPEALSAGANAFISKTDPPDVVMSAIAHILKE